MPVTVQGPDGNTYQFPDGTDKNAAIRYFTKKGIGTATISSDPNPPEQKPFQKFQGPFVERAASQFGEDLNNAKNFIPHLGWSDLIVPGSSAVYNLIKNGPPKGDPAEAVGHLGLPLLTALVTHAADSVPNPAEINPSLPSSIGKVGQSAKVIGKAAGTAVEDLPVVGSIYKGLKVLPQLRDVWKTEPPVYPGAHLPENPGVFPGASLPANPAPELLQGNALFQGGRPAPPAQSAGLGKIPTAPVYPGAKFPIATPEQINPSLISPSRTLPGMHSPEVITPPLPQPAVPIPPRQGLALPAAKIAATQVEEVLNQSLGGQKLQPGIPLREQLSGLNAQPMAKLPEGFTPVKSSAIKGYRYDPAAQEFHSITSDGRQYVHGDVSPEQAQAFIDAKSKGQAWLEIKDSSPLVAKVVNGKRMAALPPTKLRSASPNTEPPAAKVPQDGEDLTPLLMDSLKLLRKKGKGATAQ